MIDLVIAYRIYPKLNSEAFVRPGWDKLAFSEVCLRSFLESLGGLSYRFVALLDSCPDSYYEMFRRLVPSDRLELVRADGWGNTGTFLKQVEILSTQRDSEVVYFAEDDYLYVPGAFGDLVHLLRTRKGVDFVTPYDHPDSYAHEKEAGKPDYLPSLAAYSSRVIHERRHWVQSASTCCTFLTTRDVLRRTAPVFRLYTKVGDYAIWLLLTKLKRGHFDARQWIKARVFGWKAALFGRRYSLYRPIPGVATHMMTKYMAPGVDWDAVIDGRRAP